MESGKHSDKTSNKVRYSDKDNIYLPQVAKILTYLEIKRFSKKQPLT